MWALLRMVSTIVITHTFFASRDTSDFILAVLINTMQRKQNLASALGIQKENWG